MYFRAFLAEGALKKPATGEKNPEAQERSLRLTMPMTSINLLHRFTRLAHIDHVVKELPLCRES